MQKLIARSPYQQGIVWEPKEGATRHALSPAARLLNLVGEGVWEWDVTCDEVWHNPRWFQMLGLAETDRPWTLAESVAPIHPDDVDRVLEERNACLAGARTYDCCYRMLRQDGQVISVHDRGDVLDHDAEGAPLLMAGSVRDITAQREAETALRESETRFRDLAQNIPGAIFRYILRPDGSDMIEYMSPGCFGIWELSDEVIKSDPTRLWQMVHPEDLPAMQASVMASAKELSPWSHSWRIRTPSGREKWLLGQGRPRGLGDGSILWNSLILDISEQRRIEEELREAKEEAVTAKRAMVEFLAHMSHELRTPLNCVIGFSDIMKSEMLGPHATARYRDYSGMIHESASHLLDVLSDLIDVSKIQCGSLDLSKEPFELTKVIDFCHQVLNERISRAELTYEQELPSPDPKLLGDRIRVKQVLLNVIGNAIKFTPPGGRIAVKGRDRGDAFELVISDTGCGIASEQLPHVTDPFWQARSEVTHACEGAGLGLYICDRIMQLHGGKLAIRSKPGEGTEVTLAFPAPCKGR